jgi:hypothetical protein
VVRVPRGLVSPAGAYSPGRLRWGPSARPIGRTPVQAYRQVQGIPLQPSTAQAIIGGGVIPGGGSGNFAQAVANLTNTFNCEIWADPNCAAGQSSVTVSFSGLTGGGNPSRFAIYVMEWSGINTASPVDKTNSGVSVSSSTFSSGATGVLTQADEVIIGAITSGGSGGTQTITGPSSPWANFAQLSPVSTVGFLAGYQVVSATTSQTYSGTIPAGSAFTACIASFKATGTPALVQSPPGVASNALYTASTTAITVNLTQPTAAGNCLIVAIAEDGGTGIGFPLVSGITTSASTGSSSGLATCQLGPAGLGNVWYPTQVTLSTTTGITTGLDTSVAGLYLGPSGVATYLLGTVFGGNGIVAAALPNIQPGIYLIAKWTGGNNGDLATMNVQGVMDAAA